MNPNLLKAAQWITRHVPLVLGGSAVLTALVAYPLVREHDLRKADQRVRQMAELNLRTQKEHAALKKRHEELETDRNNILLQTKGLLQEKAKWTDAAEELEALKKANEAITRQKDKLLAEMQKSRADLENVSGHFGRIKNAYQELRTKHSVLESESAQLRQALIRGVEAAPQYQALGKEARALRSDNARLNTAVKTLEGKLKSAGDRINKIQERDRKFAKQIDADRKAIRDLELERDRLARVNGEMNQLAAEAPARFKDMAEENRRLIFETAGMHYNMGVFFLEQRNLERAEKELRRAVELDPNNAKAHYNLGYLYSEELDKHGLAIVHFNKFLELRPQSKESEVVRSYLLLRQGYGDQAAPRR